MATENNSVILEIRNQKVKEDLANFVHEMRGFSIMPEGANSGDLLIKEIGVDIEREFADMHDIRETGKIDSVFLTSANTDPNLLIRALRFGAKEFFPQPIKREDFVNALLKFKNEKRRNGSLGRKTGKIINVVGSKGGIGTTTLAVNLAATLNQLRDSRSVALIDMNLLFGEVPLFLDIEPAFNWGEVARNISRVDSTYLMGVLSKHSSGIYVLPSPTALDGMHASTPDVLERLLELMRTEFDFVVIDSGQSLDNISLKLVELSDIILINSILTLPCLVNVKRLLETFGRMGMLREDDVKVVINRYHKNSIISQEEAEKGLGKNIFWLLPNDFQTTTSAINQGKPLTVVAQNAEITRNFAEMAAKLAGKREMKKEKKGWAWLKTK